MSASKVLTIEDEDDFIPPVKLITEPNRKPHPHLNRSYPRLDKARLLNIDDEIYRQEMEVEGLAERAKNLKAAGWGHAPNQIALIDLISSFKQAYLALSKPPVVKSKEELQQYKTAVYNLIEWAGWHASFYFYFDEQPNWDIAKDESEFSNLEYVLQTVYDLDNTRRFDSEKVATSLLLLIEEFNVLWKRKFTNTKTLFTA